MPRILDESYWPNDLANFQPNWKDPIEKVSYATLPQEPVNFDTIYEKDTGLVYAYLIRLGAWVKSPPAFINDAELKLKRLRRSQDIYMENLLSFIDTYPKEKGLDEFLTGLHEIISKVREEQERICR
jgi:hypothetical protein